MKNLASASVRLLIGTDGRKGRPWAFYRWKRVPRHIKLGCNGFRRPGRLSELLFAHLFHAITLFQSRLLRTTAQVHSFGFSHKITAISLPAPHTERRCRSSALTLCCAIVAVWQLIAACISCLQLHRYAVSLPLASLIRAEPARALVSLLYRICFNGFHIQSAAIVYLHNHRI